MLPREVDDCVWKCLVVPVAVQAPRLTGIARWILAIWFNHPLLLLSVLDDFQRNEFVSKKLQLQAGSAQFLSKKDAELAHGYVKLASCFI